MSTAKRKQVAQLAGVSEATVSRVLNGVGPVREETRRKVLEAAEQLGYYPNSLAKSMVLQKSGNIGVFLPYVPKVRLISTYYFSEILSGIGHEVREHGLSLLLQFQSPDLEPAYSLPFRTKKIDGAIILGAREGERELAAFRELREMEAPFCVVGARFAESGFCEVDADYRHGARLAVRHLYEQGYRRIACVTGDPHYSNTLDREQGVHAEFRRLGIPHDDHLRVPGNYSRKSGYEAGARLYEMRGRFDAVFAANDRMAIGLMQYLKEQGMEAGRDYGLVGFDDEDASRWCDPPLTTVRVPFFAMGRRAARMIIDMLNGTRDLGETREELPVELVVRRSTARISSA
jgi:LacI family transcriptional regulator